MKATCSKSQVTGHEQSSHWSVVTMVTGDYRHSSLFTSHQSLVTSRQPLAASRQSLALVTGHQLLVTSYQLLLITFRCHSHSHGHPWSRHLVTVPTTFAKSPHLTGSAQKLRTSYVKCVALGYLPQRNRHDITKQISAVAWHCNKISMKNLMITMVMVSQWSLTLQVAAWSKAGYKLQLSWNITKK